jgi:hypothetical protein
VVVRGTDLNKLETTAEPLGFAFYLLIAMALILALAGSLGYAFLLLVFAACAHAARAGIEEFVANRGRRAQAKPKRVAPARRPTKHPARRAA